MPPKRPNPKKDKSARRKRSAASGTFTAGYLDPTAQNRLAQVTRQADSAPPEAFIPIILTITWAGQQVGESANHCVDACRTLGYALAQFGIASELRATQVIIHDERNRQTVQHAPLIPRWKDEVTLDGHCVLTLPDQGRYIDATIEQFPGIGALRAGPAVGRYGGAIDPRTGRPVEFKLTARPPEGTHLAVQRGRLQVVYEMSPDTATAVITSHPTAQNIADGHRRAGINLASVVLAYTRDHHLSDLLREAAFPRLHALLDAIGDTTVINDGGNMRFAVNGSTTGLLLDELPLPPSAPAEPSVL